VLSNMPEVATAHNPLVQLYPIEPIAPSGHLPGNRSRSFQIPSVPKYQLLEGIGDFGRSDQYN
jgi:hypothetical protein